LTEALKSYLPKSSYYQLISNLAIPNEKEIWIELSERHEKMEKEKQIREIDTRRKRLDAGPLPVIKETVEREIVTQSMVKPFALLKYLL